MTDPIVFFDGTCGLCDRSVTWLFLQDRNHALRFAPLQGEAAAKVLSASQRQTLDSLVFLADGKTYERSTAVLEALLRIGGIWRLLGNLGLLVPAPLRDAVYKQVARNRYRLFGRTETCRLPSPAERAYFLD